MSVLIRGMETPVRFEDCKTIGEALELLKKRVADAPHQEVVATVRELYKTCVERGW